MPSNQNRSRIFRRFAGNRKGSAAIQFALIAPLFFALIFAILETALVFVAGQVLETALQDTARLVLTGQATAGNTTQTQFQTTLCGKTSAFFTCSQIVVEAKKYTNFGSVDLSAKPTSACAATSTASFSLGSNGDVMVVRAFYKWPLYVTGLGYYIGGSNADGSKCNKRLLSSTAVFRNEP